MAILNYTTQIAAEKTVTEIQSLLAKAKACAVLTEYDDGVLSAISFRINSPHGLLSFRMPANIQKIYQVIVRDRRITPRLRTKEQAARVAWRILKDWLEAQMAIIEAGMVDLTQVFLPYMQSEDGTTLYEALEQRGFNTTRLLGNGAEAPAPLKSNDGDQLHTPRENL